jgi:hypothetical protein
MPKNNTPHEFKHKGHSIIIYTDRKAYYHNYPKSALAFSKRKENIIQEYLRKRFTKNFADAYAFLDKDVNEIVLLFHYRADLKLILSYVSHELGHLIIGGYKTNPPYHKKFFHKHEAKADHYEQFVLLAWEISLKINNYLIHDLNPEGRK